MLLKAYVLPSTRKNMGKNIYVKYIYVLPSTRKKYGKEYVCEIKKYIFYAIFSQSVLIT